jgi:transcriptional regulator with XRE-family HTH domain
MWLERIIEEKKSQNITTKTMAIRANLPEDTIARILSGKTRDPRLETVMRLGASVGLSAWEIFAESGVFVGEQNLAELQGELDSTKTAFEALKAEFTSISEEAADLRIKNAALLAENNILQMKLDHKDELLALHNYYINKGQK